MSSDDSRMRREKTTLQAMIHLYCKAHHRSDTAILCSDCNELFDYAIIRLDSCPFQGKKPTCAQCAIHCYRPDMRTRMRGIMRYSGPRMLFNHPMLAIRHLMDRFKHS